jgi:hypothetical protein
MANKKKLTVVEKFEDTIAMLRGEAAPNGSTVDELIAFNQERMAQTVKKNASGSKAERKPTAQQIENEGIKEQIVAVLSSATEPMTATAVGKALGIESNHRVSALLTQLKKENIVLREEIKGRAMFSVPKDENAE